MIDDTFTEGYKRRGFMRTINLVVWSWIVQEKVDSWGNNVVEIKRVKNTVDLNSTPSSQTLEKLRTE